MQSWNTEPTISEEERQQLFLILNYKKKISRYAYKDTKKYNQLNRKVDEWTKQLARYYTKKEVQEYRKGMRDNNE